MTAATLDAVAIDCPDPPALAKFYGDLLGVESHNNDVYPSNGPINLWFQKVENYQPPTWPTQERGQQVHLDFASGNYRADIAKAISLGATLTEQRDGYHYPILLDPVGHPFCLVSPNDSGTQMGLSAVNFDCEDVPDLVRFYHQLLGGEIEAFEGWSNLLRGDELALSFQSVPEYQPPTWPTQERGQHMHLDFQSNNRNAAVSDAISFGAVLQDVYDRFTVLLDPAGHPFCICDPDEPVSLSTTVR